MGGMLTPKLLVRDTFAMKTGEINRSLSESIRERGPVGT